MLMLFVGLKELVVHNLCVKRVVERNVLKRLSTVKVSQQYSVEFGVTADLDVLGEVLPVALVDSG